MKNSHGRSVLLIGSVPLDSAGSVFEMVGARLGPLVKRIPDGETGHRANWITWQLEVLKNTKGLEPGGVLQLPGGNQYIRYGVKPDFESNIEFGPLGYATEAIRSYELFRQARSAQKIPQGTRFQVSLPTPIAVVNTFCLPAAVRQVWPAYEARLGEEIRNIARVIPHHDLAIQWDIAVEFCFILGNPELSKLLPKEALIASIARVNENVPVEAELGAHLCIGDPGHKHLIEPKDTGMMVDFANNLVKTVSHRFAWVHMPVPRERDDEAYFAPLKGLRLDSETELYLGLVHLTDGVAGARRRLAAAKKVVSGFGIATECGFGRRPPGTIPDLLDLHREIAFID